MGEEVVLRDGSELAHSRGLLGWDKGHFLARCRSPDTQNKRNSKGKVSPRQSTFLKSDHVSKVVATPLDGQ